MRLRELLTEVQDRIDQLVEGRDRLDGLVEAMLVVTAGLDLDVTLRTIGHTAIQLGGGAPGATRLRQRVDQAIGQFAGAGLHATSQFVGPLSVVDATLADHAEAVVREAVSNAVRHADATELTVRDTVADDLCIEVADNGRGIDGSITESGLHNLRTRADDAAGIFTVGGRAGGGTLLRWCAPLP
ncbi:hypothetical protein MDOR_28970 [Mycolicibacterium doricum]|uniref:Histidine kinase/HSP90-like ATPase domain-containing protein n=1 Tax=Mycolicibacterium doricum TaxID=126673 RepID=A0A1X1T3S8_9MYCO|nr:hypothetical protein AWC01_13295 [Mycolicibacterium doricum]BBZ08728.1 hypothetical protein MDOR_28970 [Mycolicibacterium doricum]